MPNYVIIGDGAAGITAAQAIRAGDPDATLTILSADPSPHYYRAALTNYLLGQLRDDELWGVPPDFYTRHRLGRYYGQVLGVDTARGLVALDSGQRIPYDALLIASGAAPTPLQVPGATLAGVMTFRTLQDARRIVDLLPDLRQAIVVGGGTLGLEWVQGLRHTGIDVTYVLRERQFMGRILDAAASDLVLQQLRAAGVSLALDDEVAAIDGQQGRVARVRTRAGRQIPCQLVGAAIGVRPNVAFLAGSGVATDRGVLTDAGLRTNLPAVFAAGDVAQVRDARGRQGPPAGLWQPARAQGRVAGANMVAAVAGHGEARRFDPGAPYVATHLYDLDFVAVGETQPSDTARLDTLVVRAGAAYRKLLLRDGRLIGALLIGDRRNGLVFKRLIDLATEVSPIRARLLDEHFDLAGWVDRQQTARAARRGGLTDSGRALPGAPPTAPLSLAVDAAVATAPRLDLTAGTRRAARLTLDGRAYPVARERPTTIGRAPECDVVLADLSVSRRHAEIVPRPGGYALRDLRSANGSWVGLARSQPGTPQALRDGDLLRCGEVSLAFALGQGAAGEDGLATSGAATLVGPAGAVALTQEITSLGRAPDSDVVVGDQRASRLHAQILRAADGALYLRDMGSANGTIVNGARVFDAHPLRDGDTIGIGTATFTFRRVESGATTGTFPAGELTVVRGSGAGARHALRGGDTTIGRDPDNTIALADPLATRRHAAVAVTADGVVVRDLGSSNGTWVNGARLAAPRLLQDADTIDIGQTRFLFRRTGAGAVRAAVAAAGEATRLLDLAPVDDAAPAPARPALEIVAGAEPGRRFALRPGAIDTIGRDAQVAIIVRDNLASRRHAEVSVDPGGGATIRDLGSSNGTLVNGRRLDGPRPLRDGDEVTIGATTLRFTAG